MFSILLTPLVKGEWKEKFLFLGKRVERETFILGRSQFPLLVTPLIRQG